MMASSVSKLAATTVLGIVAGAVLDCSVDDFYCIDGEPACAVPGCNDGILNGTESDVDCGGECGGCETEKACGTADDCEARFCTSGMCCVSLCPVWSRSYGALVDDDARAAVMRSDGSVIVVGSFVGVVDFGGGALVSEGGRDAFILALGTDGRHLWSTSFGGEGDDAANEVVLAHSPGGQDDHVIVAVQGASQVIDFGGGPRENHGTANPYLVELDPAGEHVWSKAIETSNEVGIAGFGRTPSGDLYLSGSYYQVDFGGGGQHASKGGYDVYVARLDAQGNHIWSKSFGSVWHDLGGTLAVDANGSVIITTLYSRSWSFGGEPLPWNNGSAALGVAKLSPDGEHLWSHGYGHESNSHAADALLDDSGNLYLVGEFSTDTDFGTGVLPVGASTSGLVLKYAPDGQILWARRLGDHTATVHTVAPNGQGGVLIGGVFKGDVDFGDGVVLEKGLSELFLANLDESGTAIAAESFAGRLTDAGVALAKGQVRDGDFIVAVGSYRDTLRSNAGDLATTSGGLDAFVLGLNR